MKTRQEDSPSNISPTATAGSVSYSSEQNVLIQNISTMSQATVRPQQPLTGSISSSELFHNSSSSNVENTISSNVAAWNPFEDPPFSQMSEDHIFGAEFDKIRQEGSQSS